MRKHRASGSISFTAGIFLPAVIFPVVAYFFPIYFDYFIAVVGAWILADWFMRIGHLVAQSLPSSLDGDVVRYFGLIAAIMVASTLAALIIGTLLLFNAPPSSVRGLIAVGLKSFLAVVLMLFYVLLR